jgi:hypothetical protein
MRAGEKIETFSGVTALRLEGGGSIHIEEDGTIVGVTKVTQKAHILELTGLGGASFTSIGGTTTFGGMTMTNVSGANFSGSMVVNNGGGQMMINGRLIDLSRLDEIAIDGKGKNSQKDQAKDETIYRLAETCSINSVKINSSADLVSIPVCFTHDEFTVVINGSGDVSLPKKRFKMLQITISGSGDVKAKDVVETEYVQVAVNGSGDVRGIHVLSSGSISINGSGDVMLTAEDPTRISKNTYGSGKIKIR